MTVVSPILLAINPFDSTRGTSVYYTYTGSQQSTENNLRITDKVTGLAVYDFNYIGFEKVHHIPPSELVNGNKYVARIRVRFLDGTYSPYSNEVEFNALATPVVDIESIDGQGYVYNADVTFVARFTQDNGELVENYRFNLYDEQGDLIQKFPLRYPDDASGVLTEVVKKLEKGKGYFIECIIETTNGFIWSQKEKFIPLYLVPSINGVIQTEDDVEEGFVRITANLKDILGTQVRATDPNDTYISDNYQYEESEWVVVPSDNPLIFKGLGMNRASDFVAKIWCRDVPVDTMFLELRTKDNSGIPIQFWRYQDRVVAVKKYSGITSRHRSNIILVPEASEFLIYVKAIEHRIDLSLQIL
jgi:hypothetical protein